jgi:hypothetical protein
MTIAVRGRDDENGVDVPMRVPLSGMTLTSVMPSSSFSGPGVLRQDRSRHKDHQTSLPWLRRYLPRRNCTPSAIQCGLELPP